MKSPAFQWYPRDILSSARVQEMSLAEEGAYRRLIDYCWLNGSIPSDPERLIRIIGKGATTAIAKVCISMFSPHPDKPERLIHDRLEVERQKQEETRQKRVEAANSRWALLRTNENPSKSDVHAGGKVVKQAKKSVSKGVNAGAYPNADANELQMECSSSASSTAYKMREREKGEYSEKVDRVISCRPEFSRLKPEDVARIIHDNKSNPAFEQNFENFIMDAANQTDPPKNPTGMLRAYLSRLPLDNQSGRQNKNTADKRTTRIT